MKIDHIHFSSQHITKIKNVIIVGFYLRAQRNCSPRFLNDELDYIENSFTQLQYHKSFIQRSKIKAFKIHKRKSYPINSHDNFFEL